MTYITPKEIDELIFQLLYDLVFDRNEKEVCNNQNIISYSQLSSYRKDGLRNNAKLWEELSNQVESKTNRDSKFYSLSEHPPKIADEWFAKGYFKDVEKGRFNQSKYIQILCATYLIDNNYIGKDQLHFSGSTAGINDPLSETKMGEHLNFGLEYFYRVLFSKVIEADAKLKFDDAGGLYQLYKAPMNSDRIIERFHLNPKTTTNHNTDFYFDNERKIKEKFIDLNDEISKNLASKGNPNEKVAYITKIDDLQIEPSGSTFQLTYNRDAYFSEKVATERLMWMPENNMKEKGYENDVINKILDYRKKVYDSLIDSPDDYISKSQKTALIMNVILLNNKLDKVLVVLRARQRDVVAEPDLFSFGVYETMLSDDKTIFDVFNRTVYEELNLLDDKMREGDEVTSLLADDLVKQPKYVSEPLLSRMYIVWKRCTVVTKTIAVLKDNISEDEAIQKIENSVSSNEIMFATWLELDELYSANVIRNFKNKENTYYKKLDKVAKDKNCASHKGLFFQAPESLKVIWSFKKSYEQNKEAYNKKLKIY